MMKALAAFVLVACSVAPAFANVRPSDADFTWKPAVGETNKYKLDISMSADFGGQATDIKVSFVTVSEIKEVKDGKVTSEGRIENFRLTINGNESPVPDDGAQQPTDSKATVVQDLKTGRTISMDSKGADGQQQSPRVRNLGEFRRPEGTIKVGDSWKVEVPENKEEKTPAALAKYTLVGEEEVLGHKCWKVTYAYSETGVQQPFGATGTYWIDQAKANTVKFDASYENVVFNEMMPPSNAKVTMVLVP